MGQGVKSVKMRWVGHVAGIIKISNAYRIAFRKHETILLGRSRSQWEDTIKMDLKINTAWAEFSWLWLGTSGGLL
jgi:hypothetical protein